MVRANQTASDFAPICPGRSNVLAWVNARDSSSANRARSASILVITAVVSSASSDHAGAPAMSSRPASSRSRKPRIG